jgi:hypothetical protein
MKGNDMMKTSTKLKVAGAASLLGVALAASGAFAATGSLTSRGAPGQVLPVIGVGPASGHASATAHANPNAKGLVGATSADANAAVPSRAVAMPMVTVHGGVGQVAVPVPQTLPAHHGVMLHVTAPTQQSIPQPVSGPGMNMSSSPMR